MPPAKYQSFFSLLCRIELLLLALVVAAQLLCFAYIFNLTYAQRRQAWDWDLANAVSVTLRELCPSREQANDCIQAVFSRFAESNPESAIYLLDEAGTVLASEARHPVPTGTRISLEPVGRFLATQAQYWLPVTGIDPATGTTQLISASTVNVAGPARYVYATLANSTGVSPLSILFTETGVVSLGNRWLLLIFTMVLVSIFWISVFTEDFQSLTPWMKRFASGDFRDRIPELGSDEIGRHAEVLNHMADSIVSLMSQRRERDRLQSELVSNISHDLRGPLALIQGYSEELLEHPETAPEKRQRFLLTIESNAEALRRLLTDLKELSSLEGQRTPPSFEKFSGAALFETIYQSYQVEAERRGITLVIDAASELPPAVGNPPLLLRALTNLLENALRYTPPGGSIRLQLREAREKLAFSIANTGSHIPSDQLPSLFERTYQSPTQRSEQLGSSGLGLTIVKRIIEAHGSIVSVRSSAEEGTEFSFTLDMAARDTELTAHH